MANHDENKLPMWAQDRLCQLRADIDRLKTAGGRIYAGNGFCLDLDQVEGIEWDTDQLDKVTFLMASGRNYSIINTDAGRVLDRYKARLRTREQNEASDD